MNDTTKTHYRKAFNSPYLSSADIVEPITLTISRVALEPDRTKRTKELFNTAYFSETEIRPGEKLKPMILNVGNTEVVREFAGGSKYLEEWALPITVTLYVLPGVKFGKNLVDGLRIDPNPPKARKQLQQGTQQWESAIVAYKRDGNLDAVKSRVDVSEEDEATIIEAANAIS